MTNSLLVTLAIRPEASITTNAATSSGVVKRPVAKPPMLATTLSRALSLSLPVALATVSATPPAPNQRSVTTGPGDTQLTRIPRGPNSCDKDLLRLTSAAFADDGFNYNLPPARVMGLAASPVDRLIIGDSREQGYSETAAQQDAAGDSGMSARR